MPPPAYALTARTALASVDIVVGRLKMHDILNLTR